jgi:hypothetical protein
MDFSIVAATIPTVRRFVSGLATHYGALDQKKTTGESSYEIRSSPMNSAIKSADRDGRRLTHFSLAASTRRSSSAQPGPNGGYLMPSDPSRNRGIGSIDPQVLSKWNRSTGNDGVTATHVIAQDSHSVGSNDSQQMIIKKDMAWTVEHGPKTSL